MSDENPLLTLTTTTTDDDFKITISFQHRPGYVLCEEKDGNTIKYYYSPLVAVTNAEEPEIQETKDRKDKPGMRVPYVGPRPRPILSPKEELFAAELYEIRVSLAQIIEQLRFVNFQTAALTKARQPFPPVPNPWPAPPSKD